MTTETKEEIGRLADTCKVQAIRTYSSAHFLRARANRLSLGLKVLTFITFLGPLVVGIVLLGEGDLKWIPLDVVKSTAVVVAGIQLIGGLWALTSDWSGNLTRLLESASANFRLSARYDELALDPPKQLSELLLRKAILDSEDETRSIADNRLIPSSREARVSMRAALYQLKMPCSTCRNVPHSPNAALFAGCATCGSKGPK